MPNPNLLAALLAVVPLVLAQDIADTTVISTRCSTAYDYTPVATSTTVDTYYTTSTTTNTAHITYTTQDTVTVTPIVATTTNVVSLTTTVSTTTTTTPATITIPTPRAFLPLILANLANPTPIPRIKRVEYAVGHPLKRQTADGNTGGFIVNPDGTTSDLDLKYPKVVACRILYTVNTTRVSVVTADPTTTTVAQATATAMTTNIVSVTTTFTEIAPKPTIYAACAKNNVVSHITDSEGNEIIFDRVIYRPTQGFPIANELIVNTTSSINCCIACQNTPNCAGSFYAPSHRECHLRLTVPFVPIVPIVPITISNYTTGNYTTGNSTIGNSTGIFPTATAPSTALHPISTATPATNNATCAAGSMSLYLGVIRGRAIFPESVALVFSNGACGHFTVSPLPIDIAGDPVMFPSRKMLIGRSE